MFKFYMKLCLHPVQYKSFQNVVLYFFQNKTLFWEKESAESKCFLRTTTLKMSTFWGIIRKNCTLSAYHTPEIAHFRVYIPRKEFAKQSEKSAKILPFCHSFVARSWAFSVFSADYSMESAYFLGYNNFPRIIRG